MPRDEWRVITVKQPWAGCIAGGHKPVENRSMTSHWRGPLAIHAGAAWSPRGAEDPRVTAVYDDLLVVSLTPSAVVAIAELADVHADTGCCRPWGESTYHDTLRGSAVRQVFHYVLERIVPVVPAIEAAGKLGLWKPDPDLADELDRLRAD